MFHSNICLHTWIYFWFSFLYKLPFVVAVFGGHTLQCSWLTPALSSGIIALKGQDPIWGAQVSNLGQWNAKWAPSLLCHHLGPQGIILIFIYLLIFNWITMRTVTKLSGLSLSHTMIKHSSLHQCTCSTTKNPSTPPSYPLPCLFSRWFSLCSLFTLITFNFQQITHYYYLEFSPNNQTCQKGIIRSFVFCCW